MKKISRSLMEKLKKNRTYKKVVLPNKCQEVNGVYCIDDTPITNFNMRLIRYLRLLKANECKEYLLLLQFRRPDSPGREEDISVDLSRINDKKYLGSILPPEFLIMNLSTAKSIDFLCSLIKNTCASLVPEDFVYAEGGYGKYNDIPYYTIGDLSITTDPNLNLYNDSDLHVRDFTIGAEWFPWFIRFINAKWIEPALFLTAITSYILYLINDNYDRRYVVFVRGKTAVGKTSTVSLFTDIFKDSGNSVKLSSDKKGLSRLSDYPNCPVLADDYSKTSSNRNNESSKSKVDDIIGQVQTSGRVIRDNKDCSIQSILFVTSEKKISNKSSLNRCLVFPMDTPFDEDEMTWLQRNKSLFLSFIYDFIMYLLVEDDVIRDRVEAYRIICESEGKKYREKHAVNPRTIRNKETLEITLLLLKDFLGNKLHIHEDNLRNLDNKFRESIDTCISNTLCYLKENDDKQGTEFFDYLVYLCVSPQFIRGTDSMKVFNTHMKAANRNSGYLPKYIFYYDKKENCCCIKSNVLLRYLLEEGKFEKQPTEKAIIKQLKYLDVIRRPGSEFTRNRKSESTYKISGYESMGRFLHIRCSELINREKELLEKMGNNTFVPKISYHTLEEAYGSDDDDYYES